MRRWRPVTGHLAVSRLDPDELRISLLWKARLFASEEHFASRPRGGRRGLSRPLSRRPARSPRPTAACGALGQEAAVRRQQRVELVLEQALESGAQRLAFRRHQLQPEGADDRRPRKADEGHDEARRQVVVAIVAVVLDRVAGEQQSPLPTDEERDLGLRRALEAEDLRVGEGERGRFDEQVSRVRLGIRLRVAGQPGLEPEAVDGSRGRRPHASGRAASDAAACRARGAALRRRG